MAGAICAAAVLSPVTTSAQSGIQNPMTQAVLKVYEE